MTTLTAHGSFSAERPAITACSSIRLLVVCASVPEISFLAEPHRSRHAQPPGPGFPRHDPSVNRITCFTNHLRQTIRDMAAETSGTSASVRSLSPSSDSFPSEASAMMSASRLPVLSATCRAACSSRPRASAILRVEAARIAIIVLSRSLRFDTSKQTLECIAVRNVIDRLTGEIQLATDGRVPRVSDAAAARRSRSMPFPMSVSF